MEKSELILLRLSENERQGSKVARAIRNLYTADGIPDDEGQVMLAQRICANLVLDGIPLYEARNRAIVKSEAYSKCKNEIGKEVSISIITPLGVKIRRTLKGLTSFFGECFISA